MIHRLLQIDCLEGFCLKKVWITIYKWFVISIILQLVLLAYIDVRILGSNPSVLTSAEFERDNGSDKDDNEEDTIGIEISDDARNIKFSYDLSFLAYMIEDVLIIREASGNRLVRKISPFDEESDKTLDMSPGKISHFTWMEDRNIFIYASSIEGQNYDEIEVRTIDFELEEDHIYENRMSGLQKGSKLRSLEVTYLTNMLYSQVLTDTNERLYAYDIMGNLSFVRVMPRGSKIRDTRYYDSVFIDENNGRIQIYDGLKKTTRTLELEGSAVLLDVDRNDSVYIGMMDDDGMIESIKTGQVQRAQVQDWETIELDDSVMKAQIMIDFDGNMYINDMKKRRLTQISEEGRILDYEGMIIEIRQEYVITRNNGFLEINDFMNDTSEL